MMGIGLGKKDKKVVDSLEDILHLFLRLLST